MMWFQDPLSAPKIDSLGITKYIQLLQTVMIRRQSVMIKTEENTSFQIPNYQYDRNTRFTLDDVEVGTRLIRHSIDGISFWRVFWLGPKWSDQVYMVNESTGDQRGFSLRYVCRAAMWELMN
jgi:hypothetical protein